MLAYMFLTQSGHIYSVSYGQDLTQSLQGSVGARNICHLQATVNALKKISVQALGFKSKWF